VERRTIKNNVVKVTDSFFDMYGTKGERTKGEKEGVAWE